MIEVYPLLHVGSEHDYESNVRSQSNWRVVHACKEPYHREALGYTGRGAPKSHPEYLIARREERLILNLVDAPDPAYISEVIIDAALEFIHQSITDEVNVLVHCNEGVSRSPSIGFLYLLSHTDALQGSDLATTITEFQELYPPFNPAAGMNGFIRMNFDKYFQSHS